MVFGLYDRGTRAPPRKGKTYKRAQRRQVLHVLIDGAWIWAVGDLSNLVPSEGLEPTTFCSGGRRSIPLS